MHFALLSAASVPEQAIANLRKVRSFRYALTMSRTEPPIVAGEFSGAVILPDTQEQEGAWANQSRFRLKARGDIEYLRDISGPRSPTPDPRSPPPDTSWSVQLRGDEADFIAQVERALARDSFAPIGEGREFSFAPNVPFLDPLFSKKLSGRIRIRQDRVLPEEISITSSDQVVSWQARFSDYDQVPPVSFPFVKQWRIALVRDSGPKPETPDARFPTSDTAILRRRLARHGYECQFSWSGDTLVTYLEREIRDDLLAGLVQPGEAEVWIGRLALFKGPLPQGAKKLPLFGDTTQKLIVEKLVLSHQDISRTVVIDSVAGPVLQLILTRVGAGKAGKHNALEKSGMYWVLVMDDAIVALAKIAKRPSSEQIDLTGPENLLAALRLKTVLDSPVLSGHWKVTAKRKS